MYQLALGGCITACILSFPGSLYAQGKTPIKSAPAIEIGAKSEPKPAIESGETSPAREKPEAPALETQDRTSEPLNPEHHQSRPAADSDNEPQREANEIARRDLAAQQSMAESTFRLVEIAWWQVGIGVAALVLLGITVHYTRKASIHAEGAGKAAREAAAAANRQADAAVLLEAAKIVISEVRLAPVGGGHIQTAGAPENGHTPSVFMKNIGNTRAFILRTSLILKVSAEPPKKRYPLAGQVQWPVAPGIQADDIFRVKDDRQTVSLSDNQRKEIETGRMHLWLIGCVWFRDWFGIEREEGFLLRWKLAPHPNERPGVRLGFISHDNAQ